MNPVTIICRNPVVEKLLRYMTAELPECGEAAVLLDMAQMERICEFEGSKVILFSVSADPGCLAATRKTKAAGFWYLEPSVQSLSKVLSGQPAFPEKPPEVMLGNSPGSAFTHREMDVLRQLALGKSDADIASALSCSVSTVKHYLQSLREKTGICSRVELATRAVDTGLISINCGNL